MTKGDLNALDEVLAAHRGQRDFAYYFTTQATPRALGDVLASVAGPGAKEPLETGIDESAYDIDLLDLAGVLSLATHGVGDRALPASWADDFAAATTTPSSIYPSDGDGATAEEKQRADQDLANKQNLLLLLSRGSWSTDFLQTITAAYWTFDHDRGADAWPGPTLTDAKYAPASNGVYLTDGMAALTAALTANPDASAWAFTDFQPGIETVTYDDTDYSIGMFSHYLFFEHAFPDGGSDDGDGVGMTAALTALAVAGQTDTAIQPSSINRVSGPMADVANLQALAQARTATHDEGSTLSKVAHRVAGVGSTVWHFIEDRGHQVLFVLSLLTLTREPHLVAIGVGAALTNAGWYAVEGDYTNAGISLVAVLPGLPFGKIALAGKGLVAVEEGVEAAGVAEQSISKLATAARIVKSWLVKPWRDCQQVQAEGGLVIRMRPHWTRAQRNAAVQKAKALSQAAALGELRKTLPVRSSTEAAKFRREQGVKVGDGQDVDHTIDLQLGGADDAANLQVLDRAVNRSFGRQISAQLDNVAYGTQVLGVAICPVSAAG